VFILERITEFCGFGKKTFLSAAELCAKT